MKYIIGIIAVLSGVGLIYFGVKKAVQLIKERKEPKHVVYDNEVII